MRWTAKPLFGLAIVAALAAAIPPFLSFQEALAAGPPAIQAPAFTLRLLDGKVLNSKMLRGRPVVLRFLASW